MKYQLLRMVTTCGWALLGVILASFSGARASNLTLPETPAAAASLTAEAKPRTSDGFGAEDLPKGWELQNPRSKPDPKAFEHRSMFRSAVGGGLGFPDLIPLEGYFFVGRYFGLRGFYSLPYPFKIRVELPADDISAKNGFKFANPDVNINFQATYGPHYGADALVLPFGGAFYVGLGISHRRIHVEGGAESPLIICKANDPRPCSEQEAVIVTKTQLAVHANVTTQSWMLRTMVGWFWELGDDFYFNTQLGVARPYSVDRDVSVTSNAVTPDNASGEDLSPTLQQVKVEKEAELNGKLIEALEPYDSKTLPLVGFSFGLRF